MDTPKELLETIRLGVTERLTSPLLGTYIVSWLICNYRIVLILLGSANLPVKLNLLDDQLYGAYWKFAYVFLAPLATTLFYIFLYPKIAKPVYELRLKNIHDLSEIRRKIENETPLTAEAAQRIRLDMQNQQQEFTRERARYEQLIQDLHTEINVLKQNPPQLRADVAKRETTSEILQKVILGWLARQPSSLWIPENTVIGQVVNFYPKLSEVRIRSALDSLRQKSFITYTNSAAMQVSEMGRSYIVANNLDDEESYQKTIGSFPTSKDVR